MFDVRSRGDLGLAQSGFVKTRASQALAPVLRTTRSCSTKPDNKLTFNKLDSVFTTGNATRDDAPNHIKVQEKVPLEVALMWQNMCPAQVYEVPEEELEAARADGNGRAKRPGPDDRGATRMLAGVADAAGR